MTQSAPDLKIVRKRRWWQFSVRSLLIVIALVAIALGTYMHGVRSQERAVAEIRELGGSVGYEPNWLGIVLPESMEKRIGDDFYANAVSAQLRYRTVNRRKVKLTDAELEQAIAATSRLPHVTQLRLQLHGLQDDDIAKLAPLRGKIKELTINELYHGKLKGNQLEELGRWKRLESLTILSSSTNKEFALAPLSSLKNLTYLSIGTDTLNESVFADIAKIESLQTLHLFCCRFDGEHLRHLQRLPKLKTLSLHNTHPVANFEYYTKAASGELRPQTKTTFRFERWSDAWMGSRTGFPNDDYKDWLETVLPRVNVMDMFSS